MAEGDSSPTGGLGDLVSRLGEARAELEAQAEAIDATIVEGHAAGGAVVIRLNGSLEAESVHIDPSIIDPADPALLEDAVLAALHDALGRIVALRSSLQASEDSELPGGIDLGALAGNFDLGGLLAGVDLESLMGNFGIGLDFGALARLGETGEDEDDDEYADDEVDDEPEA